MQGQVDYAINRGVKQIRSQTCTLAADGGAPVSIPCAATPSPTSTRSASSYTLALTLSSAGTYTFGVSFTLTDGGHAEASTTFSTNSAENVCTSFTGWDFADHGGGPNEPYWVCGGMYQPTMLDTVYDAVLPYCVNPRMGTLNTGVNQEIFCG
jgi:hypothetical protein